MFWSTTRSRRRMSLLVDKLAALSQRIAEASTILPLRAWVFLQPADLLKPHDEPHPTG